MLTISLGFMAPRPTLYRMEIRVVVSCYDMGRKALYVAGRKALHVVGRKALLCGPEGHGLERRMCAFNMLTDS